MEADRYVDVGLARADSRSSVVRPVGDHGFWGPTGRRVDYGRCSSPVAASSTFWPIFPDGALGSRARRRARRLAGRRALRGGPGRRRSGGGLAVRRASCESTTCRRCTEIKLLARLRGPQTGSRHAWMSLSQNGRHLALIRADDERRLGSTMSRAGASSAKSRYPPPASAGPWR